MFIPEDLIAKFSNQIVMGTGTRFSPKEKDFANELLLGFDAVLNQHRVSKRYVTVNAYFDGMFRSWLFGLGLGRVRCGDLGSKGEALAVWGGGSVSD